MTAKKPPINKELQVLKRRLKLIEQLLTQTRLNINEERTGGPGFEKELRERLTKAEITLNGIKKKIATAKVHSKKRKREIDEWKLWYNGLAQSQKPEGLQQLNQEIEWRAAEIALHEAEIDALYAAHLQAEGELEQTRIRIKALAAGSAEGPVDEDLRIKSLLQQRDELKQQIPAFKVAAQ